MIIIYDTYTYYREGPPRRASDFKQKLFTACEYFLKFVIYFLRRVWFNTLKMNEEQTFQFGPFEVTVFPATNEEDEWVEVEDCG